MFNSHLHHKRSIKTEQSALQQSKSKQWLIRYNKVIQPALLNRYNQRVNQFIQILQANKQQFHEYRANTEDKAIKLLQTIRSKERFLGPPQFRMKNNYHYIKGIGNTERMINKSSIRQSAVEQTQKGLRSICSESKYIPLSNYEFRERIKQKQIQRDMRFSQLNPKPLIRTRTMRKESEKTKQQVRNTTSQYSNSNLDDDNHSYVTGDLRGDSYRLQKSETEDRQSKREDQPNVQKQQVEVKSNKVYFKRLIDLQQNLKEKHTKKSLHQILTRFGVMRIKDLKKQALIEADKTELEML